jgi:Zn-dependent protease
VFDAQPTRFDLSFRLGPFPVRISPWFWLIAALLGDWVLQALGVGFLALWVGCVLLSILVHELGHAVMIRRFGSPTAIVLHGFGGYAEMPYTPASRWKRIVIFLAGPAAGFLLAGLVYGSDRLAPWKESSRVALAAYAFLVSINLFWNAINLLPIWPLDGGRVCREVLSLLGLRRPDAAAFAVSLVVSGLLAVYGVMVYLRQDPPWLTDVMPFTPGPFMTLWLILFAVQSYLLLQQANRQAEWGKPYHDEDDDRLPWERR